MDKIDQAMQLAVELTTDKEKGFPADAPEKRKYATSQIRKYLL